MGKIWAGTTPFCLNSYQNWHSCPYPPGIHSICMIKKIQVMMGEQPSNDVVSSYRCPLGSNKGVRAADVWSSGGGDRKWGIDGPGGGQDPWYDESRFLRFEESHRIEDVTQNIGGVAGWHLQAYWLQVVWGICDLRYVLGGWMLTDKS